MPVTDADLQLIFQYLDNELSDGEEQALLQRIEENRELQKAFDQQVLMSEYLSKDVETQTEIAAFESADNYVNSINRIINKPVELKRAVPSLTKKRWQPLAAAAAVAALIFAAIMYYSGKRNTEPSSIVKTPEKIVPKANDSTSPFPDTARQLAVVILPEKLYDEYATPLADYDMQLPAAAQPYQRQYQQGRYQELTDADENTVITKGERPPDEEQAITNYFNFYKALSYIKTKKFPKAEKLLNDVMKKSKANTALNNNTKWYLLLLYLKAGNKPEALQMATSIATNQNNPYRKRAVEIVEKLGR